METNALYYGDNLEILRKYIPNDSVDLIYLDPPFNSNATYNVLFKEPTGKSSQAQMSAFEIPRGGSGNGFAADRSAL
jgi:site-specific DNA-methyltransferase (adenine-specific)